MVYYTFCVWSTFNIKIICIHVISEFDLDFLLLYCYYQNDV